jgi:predicted DNA-binding transcriptional regulator AlpA
MREPRLPYPPPWLDMPALCQHICCSATTVDTWVMQGILPAPRKRGGKQMWKWSEVDEWLTRGNENATPDAEAERIRNATRRAAAEARNGY